MKRMLIHSIAANDVMNELGHTSKLNADWEFLTRLRDAGRAYARVWLETNFDRLGKESTTDIPGVYL
jgi:NTE family protein